MRTETPIIGSGPGRDIGHEGVSGGVHTSGLRKRSTPPAAAIRSRARMGLKSPDIDEDSGRDNFYPDYRLQVCELVRTSEFGPAQQ